MATKKITEENVIALAKAKAGTSAHAYAFGFAWGYLTEEQKAQLDQWAIEMLAELETQNN